MDHQIRSVLPTPKIKGVSDADRQTDGVRVRVFPHLGEGPGVRG
jgi:hypothetical protein